MPSSQCGTFNIVPETYTTIYYHHPSLSPQDNHWKFDNYAYTTKDRLEATLGCSSYIEVYS